MPASWVAQLRVPSPPSSALPVPGEVLILDDASRDGSREVAQELARADERIRLIQSDENLGLPRARNVLLSQARFEHAMILDSDNQLVPSGIATLYASARQTGAVLAYGNILKVDQSGSVMGVMSNERVTANLLKENWIDAMVLVRTDRLLELGGYDCQWLYGLEDWELNQRLFSLGEPMVFVPVLVGKYTTSPDSMSHEAPLSSRYRRGLRIFGSRGRCGFSAITARAFTILRSVLSGRAPAGHRRARHHRPGQFRNVPRRA